MTARHPAAGADVPIMRDCPRYDGCSVPLCPLDRDWRVRAVVPGEAVCAYLRETGKPGDVRQRFAERYDAFVVDAALVMHEALRHEAHPRYAVVLRQIELSADTPSLIAQAAAAAVRLTAARHAKRRVPVELHKSVEGGPTPAGMSGGPR